MVLSGHLTFSVKLFSSYLYNIIANIIILHYQGNMSQLIHHVSQNCVNLLMIVSNLLII